MTKSRRLFWFAVIVFVVLCVLILTLAKSTNESTQKTLEYHHQLLTLDAEAYATLTAEAQ
jgi:bacteriorhodopsin